MLSLAWSKDTGAASADRPQCAGHLLFHSFRVTLLRLLHSRFVDLVAYVPWSIGCATWQRHQFTCDCNALTASRRVAWFQSSISRSNCKLLCSCWSLKLQASRSACRSNVSCAAKLLQIKSEDEESTESSGKYVQEGRLPEHGRRIIIKREVELFSNICRWKTRRLRNRHILIDSPAHEQSHAGLDDKRRVSWARDCDRRAGRVLDAYRRQAGLVDQPAGDTDGLVQMLGEVRDAHGRRRRHRCITLHGETVCSTVSGTRTWCEE
jgi:hypothetical protein